MIEPASGRAGEPACNSMAEPASGRADEPASESDVTPIRRIADSPARALTVFCDFDGTVTEKDMIVATAERFCPPIWKQIIEDIVARRKTVKDGVAELFALIPSSRKNEIIAFVKETMQLRAGFQEFLEFCKTNGLRFVVCSGGVDFMVETLMNPYRAWIDRIVSIPSNFSGPTIALRHNLACETEGTCKVKVMDMYPETIRILIGDSITDLHGARHATVVFARAGLKKYLDEEKISYIPFETFHDVRERLSRFGGPKAVSHAR